MTDRRERILDKVLERIEFVEAPEGFEHLGACWMWTGPTSGCGRGGNYPRMCLDGGTVAVHLVVFTHYNGLIPPRKQVDHLCRRRLCCNPKHLEMVTHKRNQKRRDASKKITLPETSGFDPEIYLNYIKGNGAVVGSVPRDDTADTPPEGIQT